MFCSTGSEKYICLHFFSGKSPSLTSSSCSAKTIGNLRKLKKYTVPSHLCTNKEREGEPRELRQSRCWKVLDQNTDALTPAREEHSPPPSHYGFHAAHVSSTLHSGHPETFIYLFFFSIKYCFLAPLLFSISGFLSHFSGINLYSFLYEGSWSVKCVIPFSSENVIILPSHLSPSWSQ